ncbi:MAG TPA: hypothetical protein VIV40_03965, partial [Kofleriaceae bacterium]
IASAAVVVTAGSSCGGDDGEQCVRCLPDPQIGDAGVGAPDAAPCPVCLPQDGVCPVGCIPEGFT